MLARRHLHAHGAVRREQVERRGLPVDARRPAGEVDAPQVHHQRAGASFAREAVHVARRALRDGFDADAHRQRLALQRVWRAVAEQRRHERRIVHAPLRPQRQVLTRAGRTERPRFDLEPGDVGQRRVAVHDKRRAREQVDETIHYHEGQHERRDGGSPTS